MQGSITKVVRLLIFGTLASAGAFAHAQDAAQPSVDLGAEKIESPPPVKSPSPAVPEISQLDEVFKQSSLGKAADEYRLRIEWRTLQNQVVNEPAVVAAKAAAQSARTDLEKRERLRDYYNIYYGRMRVRASSAEMKTALDSFKAAHLKLLDQPRVRPSGDAPIPTPATERHKHRP